MHALSNYVLSRPALLLQWNILIISRGQHASRYSHWCLPVSLDRSHHMTTVII